MPQEISDIKHFIEICRRKDASCTLPSPTVIEEEKDMTDWEITKIVGTKR